MNFLKRLAQCLAMMAACTTGLFFLALALPPHKPDLPPVLYEAEFLGQEEAEVGELCRFLTEGEIVRWTCLPETEDCESYGEHNENFVVSFRKAGTYTIVAATYTGDDLEIHNHTVVVGGAVRPTEPDVPTPAPVAQHPVNEALVLQVTGWAKTYLTPAKSAEIAPIFDAVADQIQSEIATTPSQVVESTSESLKGHEVNQGFLVEVQAYLTSQSDIGNLTTMDQHLLVWRSIAKGLKDASI